MTDQNNSPRSSRCRKWKRPWSGTGARRRSTAAIRLMPRPVARTERRKFGLRHPGWRLPFNPWFMFDRRHPVMRRLTIGFGRAPVAVVLVACGALWWRLSSGPISLDLATPWLTAAIESNFGSRYRIQVGGTQLERDEHGRTALRLRDIAVRDAAGALVASAPKAEVGIAGTSLLMGSPRAESFRLVDANMVIRIEEDGRVNVFAGGDRAARQHRAGRPRQPPQRTPIGRRDRSLQALAQRSLAANLAAMLAWIDGLGGLGADGKALA